MEISALNEQFVSAEGAGRPEQGVIEAQGTLFAGRAVTENSQQEAL